MLTAARNTANINGGSWRGRENGNSQVCPPRRRLPSFVFIAKLHRLGLYKSTRNQPGWQREERGEPPRRTPGAPGPPSCPQSVAGQTGKLRGMARGTFILQMCLKAPQGAGGRVCARRQDRVATTSGYSGV